MKFENVHIERVRNYWNNRPCNIRHSKREIGTKEYFREVEIRKHFVEPHIIKFAQFHKWKNKKVLEVGCGVGTDTMCFSRFGAKVTAVDLSEESLKLAGKRAKIFDHDVKFYQGNSEKLSDFVPLEKYDLIYSFGVLHHTPHPELAIEEIKKYMDKRGVLKIMMYNKYSWKAFWILVKYGKCAFWKFSELVAKYSEAQTGCPVTYLYSRRSIRNLLKDFSILDITIDHIFPYDIEEYKNYRYKKVWYFRYIPYGLFRCLERLFGWHMCVTAVLK